MVFILEQTDLCLNQYFICSFSFNGKESLLAVKLNKEIAYRIWEWYYKRFCISTI